MERKPSHFPLLTSQVIQQHPSKEFTPTTSNNYIKEQMDVKMQNSPTGSPLALPKQEEGGSPNSSYSVSGVVHVSGDGHYTANMKLDQSEEKASFTGNKLKHLLNLRLE